MKGLHSKRKGEIDRRFRRKGNKSERFSLFILFYAKKDLLKFDLLKKETRGKPEGGKVGGKRNARRKEGKERETGMETDEI